MPDKIFPFKRKEDFESLYANSIQYESSVWDLKLIFGQLDQAADATELHTAITLPWPQAKIAAYYVLVNLIIHQTQEGPINLPARVIPARPDASAPDIAITEKPLLEYLAWVHDQFFSANPYVPPNVSATLDERDRAASANPATDGAEKANLSQP